MPVEACIFRRALYSHPWVNEQKTRALEEDIMYGMVLS